MTPEQFNQRITEMQAQFGDLFDRYGLINGKKQTKYPIAIVAVRNPMVLSSTFTCKSTKLFNNATKNYKNTMTLEQFNHRHQRTARRHLPRHHHR